MATGRLGAFNITTTADTTVYTVPSATFSVVSVNICNRNSSTAASIRLAVATSATPGPADYIEYDTSLVANGVLERTGIVMKTGDLLVVSTPTGTPTLSVVVYGIETSTA
jgi:hypothetical protein